MADSTPGPVDLDLSARLEGEVLIVDYAIHNGLDEPIYVYAVPVDLEARALRPGEAYRDVDPDEGVLILSLIPPPPPVGVDFFQSPTPLSRRVGSGGVFHGELRLALPVSTWDGYPPIPDEPEPAVADREEPSGPEGSAEQPDLEMEVATLRLTTGFRPESGLVERRPGPDPDTFWRVGTHFRTRTAEITLAEPIPVRP